MTATPISIKLRCASWKQLAAIYERDLSRSAVFLKSAAPPPVGTRVRINLTLPTQTLIVLNGLVDRHVGPGELNGRGPGVDIKLHNVPQSALWLIETALASARRKGDMAGGESAEQGEQEGSAPQSAQDAAPAEETDVDLGAGEKLVAAEGDLVTALSQELASLRKLNPFQVLGIGYETGDEEVRAAFASLTKRYHPDRFARYESGEARRIASEIFILIRNAYQVLDTPDKRAKVIDVLNKKRRAAKPAVAPPPVPGATKPPPIPGAAKPPPIPGTAEPPAQQASAQPGPLPAEEPADQGLPQDDLARGYALLDAGKINDAMNAFRAVTRRNPNDREARIGLELAEGMRALGERDRLEAAQRFEAVLELDPNNERAARELAEMRRQATNERKSLLTRLLNQKE